MTNDEIRLAFIAASCFLAWCIMSCICYDYSHQVTKLESDKAELQSKINLLKVEIESSKNELKESHEWLGVAFNEGAYITVKYNELKKQCKRGIK